MSNGDQSSQASARLPESKVVELSSAAWKCPEQSAAEATAIKACELYAVKGTPVGNNGVIKVRIDNVRGRMLCLVLANSYLVRLRIKDGRVVAIKSVKIANLT